MSTSPGIWENHVSQQERGERGERGGGNLADADAASEESMWWRGEGVGGGEGGGEGGEGSRP